ncbi:3-dehydroquinate synthase [Alloalcanivorax venustensis]|jgi:3-dehydroquinate synthase|uniref:3-dehydroquinate synthase n=2 Tax=Alloalcanivorax venustensis TaxID=172371 RepID=A0ABS0ACF9_9GAMM|nr:3-dehydroquinate synthase [Alloalcanivorax venustensis]KXJ48065.1 MAG: 3-dehydroquinate synthase [Alcanivorax sp. Nap_24]MAQ35513.1 3-dehydroquinate synthase [Alcanivorax sp.]MCH9783872.1 3-dehydroquinate synthase [Gammaproteobacteria bacterium]MED5603332.1 3-dehydroquinate synthase [Pseudomonadota bacterium]SMO53190.1 3-dehydroquinate synthase [Alcanivorax sp. DSM 26295]|tara:strand:- start:92256 stop:93335 length:1080 start_codon:yes stop_codon:yes gene_type:complete
MQKLDVSLAERSYPIYIDRGLLGQDLIRGHVRGNQVMVVTNETIAPLYLDAVTRGLGDLQCDTLILPDGEQHKTLATLERIFDALMAHRHSRTTTLVALGGGVIGDMVGFAAACYQRGVDFIQVPTTLLAQVDSSVGGKTAVNHPRGKNMIGAFHQPRAVVIDTAVLDTLPEREFAAGMAEVIKYGLIRDPEFFQWLLDNQAALAARDTAPVAEAILRSCRNKAEVVAADETEQGNRALLNLGHTFGHAMETFTGYRDWLHGEAVSAGMVMAARMSLELGWLKQADLDRVSDSLAAWKLPVTAPEGMARADFSELMALDKKVQNGRLRLVLLNQIGDALVTGEYDPNALTRTLEAFCER